METISRAVRVWIAVIASSLISLRTLLSQGNLSYKTKTHWKTFWDFLLSPLNWSKVDMIDFRRGWAYDCSGLLFFLTNITRLATSSPKWTSQNSNDITGFSPQQAQNFLSYALCSNVGVRLCNCCLKRERIFCPFRMNLGTSFYNKVDLRLITRLIRKFPLCRGELATN